MSSTNAGVSPIFGSSDLRLPDELREPLRKHLADLKAKYLERGWGDRVGFGKRPALLVIDLATHWTKTESRIGCNLDSVVDASCRLLEVARRIQIPVFFSTYAFDLADPPSPQNIKLKLDLKPGMEYRFELDERVGRRSNEKIIRKRYASCFKGTNFHEMLTSLGVDTLIVTGCSTSHCVYATCRDATDSFRVIVPREAVGERCEVMHEVNLLDIDIDLGDVMPLDQVVEALEKIGANASASA